MNAIAAKLDPHKKLFSHILSRRQCVVDGETLLKPLVLLNRDLKRVVCVDDNSSSFLLNIENAVPIVPYVEKREDFELLMLETYLVYLSQFEDVRKANGDYFRWREYQKAKGLVELYDGLFKK